MVLRDEQYTALQSIRIRPGKLREILTLPIQLVFSDSQPSTEFLTPIRGIRKYGPYDSTTSDRYTRIQFRGVEFFLFYPKGEGIVFKNLSKLASLLDGGYFERRGKRDVIFDGFENEFRLKEAFIPEPKEFVGYQPGNLRQELKKRGISFHDVIERGNRPIAIIGGTSHRSIRKNREQYLEAKLEFTRLGIPSQYASFYEHETGGAGILYGVGRKNLPFGYSLWNFALNIYGKVGGLAWVVRQKLSEGSKKTIDLTIGIRFVRSKKRKGFHIGYATILDRFGKLIGVVSSPPFKATIEKTALGMVVPMKVMKAIISEAIEKGINDPRVKRIFEEKQSLNLAIHRLSLFNLQSEIPGIELAITEYVDLGDFTHGLVSIVNTPSVLLFDRIATHWNVLRGTGMALSDHSATLYTAGAASLTDARAITYPITILTQNLGKENCPFKTLEEVCNHVASLAALHWQTVIPSSVRLPASLEFAQNIAQLSAYGIEPKKNSWLWRTLWFI